MRPVLMRREDGSWERAYLAPGTEAALTGAVQQLLKAKPMTAELCNGCATEAPFYKRDENCPGCQPPAPTTEELARAAFLSTMAELAAEDVARTLKYNVSLNPFSTASARHDWQMGHDNKPGQFPWDCEESYNRMWHRGRQARLLMDKINKGEPCQLPDLS